MKSLLPGHMPNLSQLVQGTEQVLPTCDDSVHGSGPGEIVFRHMSVVQRGVRSREALFGRFGRCVTPDVLLWTPCEACLALTGLQERGVSPQMT